MFKHYLVKVRNILYLIPSLLMVITLRNTKSNIIPRTLLIIRLDSIGDYILLRNFLVFIKKNKRFNNYSITLCGNVLWKDLAMGFDWKVIDKFIFIDRNKFYHNIFYKFKTLKKIKEAGFEIIINPTYTREILFGDLIVNVSDAKEKIGNSGSLDKHLKWKRKLLTDGWYTKLINVSKENLFEFYRNKEFFENLFEDKIEINYPFLDLTEFELINNMQYKYVVIFPGAGAKERMWNISKFAQISRYIIDNLSVKIVIAGSSKEKNLGKKLVTLLEDKNVIDYTGKLSLPKLAVLISNSEFLITNDTGATHISAAVRKPFICISNANHFGRFNPYPKRIFSSGYYIYPKEVMNHINDEEYLANKYRFGSDLDINSINLEEVTKMVDLLIQKEKIVK